MLAGDLQERRPRADGGGVHRRRRRRATGANKIDRREGRDVAPGGLRPHRPARRRPPAPIEKAGSGNGLRLRAIVVRGGGEQDLVKRARRCAAIKVHGQFQGTITVDEDNSTILANGNAIKVIYADDPTQVDYTAYGIKNAILIDNTGKWRDREGPSKHLRPHRQGRPDRTGQGRRPNIVHGVNQHDTIKPWTSGSCPARPVPPTIVPAAEGDGRRVRRAARPCGDEPSFTNDQNPLDNYE